MLVDLTLTPSRVQPIIHVLALLLLSAMIWTNGLAWPLRAGLISLLLGISWWLKNSAVTHRIDVLWQGDSHTWYWQQRQGKRHTGQLLGVRHLGLVIHLTLKTASGKRIFLPVWRDQVNEQQWRRLCVLHVLNDSQQNWF